MVTALAPNCLNNKGHPETQGMTHGTHRGGHNKIAAPIMRSRSNLPLYGLPISDGCFHGIRLELQPEM